ncbi:alpha/beta-hydrolase [Aspergillus pseudotamarii]|uniref:Alpha/beta-hydrolase n=1 Tax=Aspergillus pseudotamarii TaxID=132259 RepID=A0A5N6T3S1_ASPPS|nr:alpha/beta-hydrolase [Aspergillus pseudotamarii]KAE8140953.1 alpha/beta-hydrolase [Aspergillus pseudotamarii]
MTQTWNSILVVLVALFAGLFAFYRNRLDGLLARNTEGLEFTAGGRRLISPPIVTDSTRDIKYLGSYSLGVEHYQNIFYADAPWGKRRFAPPVPFQYARGSVVDATRPGAWCPQGIGDVLPFTSRVVNISEDCLSLRVARPNATRNDARLPVMVWIHGGGHVLGSASEVLYNPDGLVRQSIADDQPLIYVAINYRLGFFGFATSKAMVENKQTNAGLRDQRAALEWVRDNIEVFGGDPRRVTVVGQSVGASDIGLHLTSFEGNKGVPFQQAIMMSGGPGLNFHTKSDLVANNTAAIANTVGCAKEGEDQSVETLECLRDVSFDVLTNLSVTTSRTARPPFGEGFFFPTFDGDFIRDRPSQLMRSGKFVKGIPVIASWVTNDGAWYAPPSTSTDQEVLDSFGLWLFSLSNSTKEKLLQLYPPEDFEHLVRKEYDGPISAQYYRAAQMNRDIWFTCPVLDFAWQYLKNGGVKPSQIWLYEHNSTRFTPAFEMMGVPMWRVAHLSDIPYVLNVQHLEGSADNSAAELALARAMSTSIAKFVNNGNPEGHVSGVETWPATFFDIAKEDLQNDFPGKLSLQIFGGRYGTTPVTIAEGPQHDAKTAIEDAMYREKLFDRCRFINSDKMREEAGV